MRLKEEKRACRCGGKKKKEQEIGRRLREGEGEKREKPVLVITEHD